LVAVWLHDVRKEVAAYKKIITFKVTTFFSFFSLTWFFWMNILELQLRRLKARGLLEDVNMDSQTIRVHDLYREFAKLESQGKLDKSADLGKRRWVWCEDASPAELEVTPSHHCWQNLTRICIKDEPSFSWHDPQTL
jgi:hypothetical protein